MPEVMLEMMRRFIMTVTVMSCRQWESVKKDKKAKQKEPLVTEVFPKCMFMKCQIVASDFLYNLISKKVKSRYLKVPNYHCSSSLKMYRSPVNSISSPCLQSADLHGAEV